MLFHRQVFWPSRFNRMLPNGEFFAEYSAHAQREAQSDRYGHIPLPHSIFLSPDKVFEVEQESKAGPILKFAVRMKLDAKRDLILVCIPRKGSVYVKTVWVNEVHDGHKTLNHNKYWKPNV